MWGRRKRRRARLRRQLGLGLLEDAMGRVQQPQEPEESETTSYPGSVPPPAAPPAHPGLRAEDVPVDNSAGPQTPAPPQGGLPAQRTGESTRHGTFG